MFSRLGRRLILLISPLLVLALVFLAFLGVPFSQVEGAGSGLRDALDTSARTDLFEAAVFSEAMDATLGPGLDEPTAALQVLVAWRADPGPSALIAENGTPFLHTLDSAYARFHAGAVQVDAARAEGNTTAFVAALRDDLEPALDTLVAHLNELSVTTRSRAQQDVFLLSDVLSRYDALPGIEAPSAAQAIAVDLDLNVHAKESLRLFFAQVVELTIAATDPAPPDRTAFEALRAHQVQLQEEFQAWQNTLATRDDAAVEAARLAAVLRSHAAYHDLVASLIADLEAGRPVTPPESGPLRTAVASFLSTLLAYREEHRRDIEDVLAGVEAESDRFLFLIGGLAVLAILVSVLSVVLLSRRIVRPILDLQRAVGRVRQGDFGVRLPKGPENELGDLMDGFSGMTKDLARTHASLLDALESSRDAEERLQEAFHELAANERLKSHILNTASHELRTPLTPMRIKARLLLESRLGPLSGRQEEAVRMLADNTERLAAIVADMADLQAIQESRLAFSKQPFDLGALVSEEAERHTPGPNVVRKTEIHRPLTVRGDEARIRQVVAALLRNATTFTDRGAIVVRARRGRRHALVSVQDTGMGIPPDKMDRLFEPFGSAHEGLRRTERSAGLGLALARGIIEAHGGRLQAHSRGEGHGSVFWFTLPLQRPARPSRPGSIQGPARPREQEPVGPEASGRPTRHRRLRGSRQDQSLRIH